MGKNKKRINKTRANIFQYWKNICIDKYGKLHYEGDYPIEESIPVIIDWEEQHCWACGKRLPSHNIKYRGWLNNENYNSIWNDEAVDECLQRAHIIADSLGGAPVESNLFLLCPQCHFESPDTTSRQMFFKWVYDRRESNKGERYYYKQALKILKEEYHLSYPVFDDDVTKVGVNVATHANAVVESSCIYSIVANGLKNRSGLDEKAENLFEDKIRKKVELLQRNSCNKEIEIYMEVLSWYKEAKRFEETEEL